MAKQKRASNGTARKVANRTLVKKTIRKVGAARATKVTGKKTTAEPVPAKRRKQRAAVSHYREEDFESGLRAYAKYRDLGVAAATDGLAQAHVIRLIGPCDPKEVSKLHYHDAEFQLVYVLNGWVKTYMDGVGEQTMRQGSCWTQPPRIKHLIRDYSDNCELLEVILPAQFKTVEVKG
ncbi:cupin domain-containing protein [Rhodopseudomonas boonkerdii]|uniref:cupin domain-containing protein n=1 Tax=Rhodopseudomonas boonkerdii TaxID=475937 RepID=UPI001E4DDE29|nr:cupin domain-containing protein [Rhodopseudomonas boonkerdii]UGV27353.1 cupin domain-containing protein [Rhodopseudomonas boonkerdii]